MSSSTKPLTNIGLIVLAWQIAGGWKAVIREKDFQLSLVVWLLCSPMWLSFDWWSQPISVLPNLLGFTLGGFAIFLGFGNDDFRSMIVAADEKKAEYLSVSAAFLLFVAAQVIALVWALVCAALWKLPVPDALYKWIDIIDIATKIGWGIGYLIFIYSLFLSLRAALRIFRLSRWYNAFLSADSNSSNDDNKG